MCGFLNDAANKTDNINMGIPVVDALVSVFYTENQNTVEKDKYL